MPHKDPEQRRAYLRSASPEMRARRYATHKAWRDRNKDRIAAYAANYRGIRPNGHFGDWRARFEARINRTDTCWLWTGATSVAGYGTMKVNGTLTPTHRIAYALSNGPIPDGMQVCHRCDTPACVRPDHLFIGTFGDNMRDKIQKGRAAHGTQLPQARLTPALVRSILERVAAGTITQRAIASELNIHPTAISRVVNKRRWVAV